MGGKRGKKRRESQAGCLQHRAVRLWEWKPSQATSLGTPDPQPRDSGSHDRRESRNPRFSGPPQRGRCLCQGQRVEGTQGSLSPLGPAQGHHAALDAQSKGIWAPPMPLGTPLGSWPAQPPARGDDKSQIGKGSDAATDTGSIFTVWPLPLHPLSPLSPRPLAPSHPFRISSHRPPPPAELTLILRCLFNNSSH